MNAPSIAPKPVQATLSQAANQSRPWVKGLARVGYLAKGIVYIIIGILAFQAAAGSGGATTDSQGALHKIAGQPFGTLLLGLVTIGLIGYAIWRLVQAALDPDNKGSDFKGVFTRLGYAISGLAYSGLALTAFKIITHARSSSGASQQDWTAKLMAQPLGVWLVGLIGAIIIALGLNAFRKAFTAKFREKLNTASMSDAQNKAVTLLGRAGYTARGVVLLLIGGFFVQAARADDATRSGGLDKALDTLARQSPWLLGIVAIGLIAYGCYALVEARYRKI